MMMKQIPLLFDNQQRMLLYKDQENKAIIMMQWLIHILFTWLMANCGARLLSDLSWLYTLRSAKAAKASEIAETRSEGLYESLPSNCAKVGLEGLQR